MIGRTVDNYGNITLACERKVQGHITGSNVEFDTVLKQWDSMNSGFLNLLDSNYFANWLWQIM